jgi:hypothetical protein
LAILTFLSLPSLLWVAWSFKMYPKLPSDCHCDVPAKQHFDGIPFLQHSEIDILNSGVCPLGKFGAWVTFIWFAIMLSLMYWKYSDTQTTPSEIDQFNKIICSFHVILFGIIFILSLIMNLPLFIRTLPYFMLQIAISILILLE